LHKLHLNSATIWQNCWHIIQSAIDSKLRQDLEAHYNNFNHKLDKLENNQYSKNMIQHNSQFCPRTVNLTKIKSTKEEMALLNYGLQHSIGEQLKTYWINLIMETEQTIKLLDVKIQNPYRILAAKNYKYTTPTAIVMLHRNDMFIL
jgi:hypothetical protein